MPFEFRDGVLVETTDPHDRQVFWPTPTDERTSSTADDQETDDTLAPGSVVAFRRRTGTGYGQVDHTTPDGRITIRPWLPIRTKQLELRPADVHLVGTLDELAELLRNW